MTKEDLDPGKVIAIHDFYRYQPGQTFKPHRHGSYMRMEPRGEGAVVRSGRKYLLRTDVMYEPKRCGTR